AVVYSHLHSSVYYTYPRTYISFIIPQHPRSPLFPYTTLFRSRSVSYDYIRSVAFLFFRFQHRLGSVASLEWKCFLVVLYKVETRSEEHTSELQSRFDLVCRLVLVKQKSIQMVIGMVDMLTMDE